MISTKIYNAFLLKQNDGNALDLDTDVLKIALFTSDFVPDLTDTLYSGLANEVANGDGYITGGETLANPALSGTTTVLFTADAAVWTNCTFTTRYAVIYGSVSSKLVMYIDFGEDQVLSSENFTITPNSGGIISVNSNILQNQYNGSATEGATDYEFYTQALGGVDDCNDDISVYPTGSYQGSWTDCVEGNNYCETGDSTYADAKDNQTGLVWSVKLDVAGDDTQGWFWANNCIEPGEAGSNGATCASDGDDGCSCVKKTSSKTGCEAIGDGNWRLPYQKELMQAYINGSWANLSSAGYPYWSATTKSTYTRYAWRVSLNTGYTYGSTKTLATGYRIRCVR